MRVPFIALALTCGAFGAPSVKSWHTRENTTALELSEGSAEIEFLSSSTFRFQRCRPGSVCPSRPALREKVPVTVSAVEGAIEFRSEYLRVAIRRSDATVQVRKTRNGDLMLQETPGASLLEWQLAAGEQVWGLGIRTGREWNQRGTTWKSVRPLLISNLGYGLFLSLPGEHEFDLRGPARITGGFVRDRVEFFFYYGPSPKEVLTEHRTVAGAITGIEASDTAVRVKAPVYATHVDSGSLAATLERLSHASFSGVLAPAVPLTAELAPVAAWLPLLTHPDPARSDPNVSLLRRRYAPYLLTYLWEARDRGVPAFRPVAMQYPDDPETFRHADEFMLGDEILVASGERVYLPRGIWTDLRSNSAVRGRQTIETRGNGTAVYARNGSILPLQAGTVVQLHYFPRLAAEFFIAEPDAEAYTKVHAGPAGEYLRLEVEPEAERDFEWIVHHVSNAESVTATGVTLGPGAWRYDESARNLHVRIRAKAGDDAIVNVVLRERLE